MGKIPFPQNSLVRVSNIPILWPMEESIAAFHARSGLASINGHAELWILGMWQTSRHS